MKIRKALTEDIIKVSAIYNEIHTAEEKGLLTTGWVRGIYPTYDTAKKAYEDDELFVMEEDGKIVAAARFNKIQDEMYKDGKWKYDAGCDEVMVMHTLVVSPSCARNGYGRAFEAFYEEYALKNNCPYLRIDTNERNKTARKMYAALGYREAGIVSCEFNGISSVNLVLLEKKAEKNFFE